MKYFIVAWLTFQFLNSIHSALKPFSTEYPARASLSQCVIQACKLYFRVGEVVNYVLPPEEVPANKSSPVVLNSILLPELFQQSKWPVVIHKPNHKQNSLDPLQHQNDGNYIMQIRNENNVSDYMEFLRLQLTWNPHGRFIVLGLLNNDNDSLVFKIVNALWKYNVLNGVLILPQWEDSIYYNVLSWFPYEDGACGVLVEHIRIIDSCSYGTNSGKNVTWFPEKLPRTFNNCSLNIRTIEYPPFVMGATKISNTKDDYEIHQGFEIYLLQYIANVLKLHPVFTMSGIANDLGMISIEHYGTGILGSLINYEYDLAVSSITVTQDRIAVLDVSNQYMTDALKYCVPTAEEKSTWSRFLQILKIDVWIAVVLTVLVLSYIIHRLSMVEPNELNMYRSFGSVLLQMYAITLGAAINIQPHSSKVRYFMMQWIFFSLSLGTAFQTFLTSVFTQPDYELQINSVDELLASELHILIMDIGKRFYRNPTNQQSENILSRLERCQNLDSCLSRTAIQRDSAVIIQSLYAEFASNKYRKKNGRALLYCFEDSIVSFPVVMIFQKGFPLRKRISEIADIVVSAGFMELWTSYLFSKIIQEEFNAEEEAESKKTITMLQLKIVYLIYAGGMTLSALVFSCEMLSQRFRNYLIIKYKKYIPLSK